MSQTKFKVGDVVAHTSANKAFGPLIVDGGDRYYVNCRMIRTNIGFTLESSMLELDKNYVISSILRDL